MPLRADDRPLLRGAGQVSSFASLPERLALDIAVAHLEHEGSGRLLLLASSTRAVSEAVSRLACPVTIVASTSRLAGEAARIIGSGIHPDPDAVRVTTTDAFDRRTDGLIERVLWLKPTQDTIDAGIALIEQGVTGTVTTAVIGVGPLDRWRSATQRQRDRSGRLADPFIVGNRLGYAMQQEWRLLGLRSAVRAPLRIIASRLGRWEIADQMEAAYRLALIESAAPRLWAIGVWIGRKVIST